jgi:D-psicose/D-tagatose/L-ribulose 3-epimerase
VRYAINNWVYNDEPLRDTFARLAKYGYEGVELKGEFANITAEEVKALSREFGLKVPSVLGWNIYPIPGRDLATPDEAERQAALRYGAECLDFAAKVGADVFVCIPAPANRTAPVGNPQGEKAWFEAAQREWELAVDSIRKTARYAAKFGIRLAVEPINRYETYLVTTVEDVLRFNADVNEPNVHINLDCFHMNIDEADPAAAVRKAGKEVIHIHAADSNRLAPGKGHTDFRAILQALKDVGFAGTFTLEPTPPYPAAGIAIQMREYLPLRDVYAKESIAYLKSIEATLS